MSLLAFTAVVYGQIPTVATPLQLPFGKLGHRSLGQLANSANPTRRLFYICYCITGIRFSVDTGAEVTIITASSFDRRYRVRSAPLMCVKATPICTYGQPSLTLHLGLYHTSNGFQGNCFSSRYLRRRVSSDIRAASGHSPTAFLVSHQTATGVFSGTHH